MSLKYYLIIFAFGLGYVFYLIIIYWRTRVPYVVTPQKYLAKLLAEMPITNHSVIYDLGSGKGDFIFAAEKYHPKKIVGYELSPLHVFYSKLKAKLIGSAAQFFCRDFFAVDLRQADIIYLFLVKSAVVKLWPKLKAEVKPGAWVIVLGEQLPGLKPNKVIINNPAIGSRYYFYQIS